MVRDPSLRQYPCHVGACALSAWKRDPARCRWCDAAVRAGSPWCGTVCEDDYRANHCWDLARSAALARDSHRCLSCGAGPERATVAKLLLRALIPMGPVEAASLWRSEAWFALQLTCSLEVNHRVPRAGQGYQSGCHHHLDGLDTLCHRCHVAVTNAQVATRRAG